MYTTQLTAAKFDLECWLGVAFFLLFRHRPRGVSTTCPISITHLLEASNRLQGYQAFTPSTLYINIGV